MQATSAGLGLMVLAYNLKRLINLGIAFNTALDHSISRVIRLAKALRRRICKLYCLEVTL